MRAQKMTIAVAIALAAVTAGATDLVLPAFALDVQGLDGSRWSSEIYLTNPTAVPIQVALADFLPGSLYRPAPCDLFMSPTRVVPPLSAVVWTANGLATDLGCAERALGAVVLDADGPIHVSSRLVQHQPGEGSRRSGVLSGSGQGFVAIPVSELPGRGEYLLSPLLWHRNPCGERAFDAYLGFANPSDVPRRVEIRIDPRIADGGVRIDDEPAELPYELVIAPHSWQQIRIEPIDLPVDVCLPPESLAVTVQLDGPLALYGSVVDRSSNDPRTVEPVELVGSLERAVSR